MGRGKRGECPTCNEKVRPRATICDWCGHMFSGSTQRGSGRRFAVTVGLIVLLAGGGFLAAKSAGLFGDKAVAGWEGAEFVNGILPGRMELKHLAGRLGAYEHVGVYANNLEWVRYRPAEEHVAELTVWLDENRVVRWARLVPSAVVAPEAMQASLRCVENIVSITPGNRFAGKPNMPGELWSGGTGYMHVVDGAVKELWLIPFSTDHRIVLRDVYGAPAPPLDVSGMGVDPRRGG